MHDAALQWGYIKFSTRLYCDAIRVCGAAGDISRRTSRRTRQKNANGTFIPLRFLLPSTGGGSNNGITVRMLRSPRIDTMPRIMKTEKIFATLFLRSFGEPLPKQVFHNFTDSTASAKLLALLISVTVLALPTLLMAQAGTLDPLFGTNGVVTTANTSANAAALQSDSKIVVAGSISAQGGLLRYDTKGHLDFSFGTGGKALIGDSNAGPAFAIAVQTDGKILAAVLDNFRPTVFRLNTNGSPDNTFGNNGKVTIQAAGLFFPPASGGLVLQPDGRILVATGKIAARLLANG